MVHGHRLGRDGEAAVVAHLRRLGWSIVARNWRPDSDLRGEVDIVAHDGPTLVFCEVKTRSGALAGDPLEAVTPAKARRLRALAAAWLAEHPQPYRPVRIDVVGVHWPPAAIAPSLHHVRDAVG